MGTTTPASKLHLYQGGLNLRTGISIDTAGTQASQQSELNLFTLGNGVKDVGVTGTRGWHLAARGNAYANPAEQNDLQLYSWNGSAINIRQYWDAAGNVGIGTTATPGLLNLFKAGAGGGAPVDLISFSAPGNTGTAEWNVAQILGDTNGANSADSYLAVNPISANGTGYVTGLVVKAGGNVGIGTTSPNKALHVVGDIEVTGTINAKYQDVAEWVESSQKLEAGTVVALDPEKSNQVLASSEAYDTKVAGVISVQPGISLGESGAGKVLVATTGRVKVRVDATRAPIKIGDLLVTSDVAGVAMKSVAVDVGGAKFHRPGTLIGKALEPLAKGTGDILVLLSLQ